MFEGAQIATLLEELEVTHVVTIPDSTLGPWLSEITETQVQVIQVCREGEAWGVAAGLYMGGASPVVMIQCTGLFESGDALRNLLHDYRLPLFAIVGYRSYLSQDTLPGDTCLTFTEPILDAWKLEYRLIAAPEQFAEIAGLYRSCRDEGRSGVALIAEGKA